MDASDCFKKAELIAEGTLSISSELRLPHFLSCSSSGPDAGSYSIVASFGDQRLKIPVSRGSKGRFSMIQEKGQYRILKDGKPYIDDVEILPCSFHAPEQAFIDLNEECIFDCAFCAAPRLKPKKGRVNIENVLSRVVEAARSGQIKAVAVTSAVGKRPSDTIDEMVSVIRELRKKTSLPIGVEPYVETRDQIEQLHEAGAEEIKINIHSWNREIFSRVCPQWDYDNILKMIGSACEIFGKGRVTSNIIYGLGEDDEDVLQGVENLAAMGCVATLRKLRVNDYNEDALNKAIGSVPKTGAERMLNLAKEHKEILKKHDLNPSSFKTMCHPCGCCDIVPFRDL